MATTRDIDYRAGDTVMIGRLALPAGDGPCAGVLVAPEANGISDHQRGRAERLAELGYVAFAVDLHGGGEMFTDRDTMMERFGQIASDPDRVQTIARAGLDVLLAEPRVDSSRIAAIGYCFGGTMALELARAGVDLKAVVGFHPGLGNLRPGQPSKITGKVLMCVGSEDPFVPPEQRAAFEEEMRAAGVDWQLHLYGGVMHTFTNPVAAQVDWPGLAYDAEADRRSWNSMLELFSETIG